MDAVDARLPLVSVVTITYNHEPFIAKAIEGVLMQQVGFPIEYIIAEDCSTDGTRKICEEYAAKYPDLIHLIVSEQNVGPKENERRAFAATRGKYIAFCEGDDYWTEPLKLQRQVDFMEAHPDYSVCFHGLKRIYDNDEISENTMNLDRCKNGFDVMDITSKDYLDNKYDIMSLTMFLRKSMHDTEWTSKYKSFRDTHQIYLLLRNGKGAYMQFAGAVHIKHDGGFYTSQTDLKHSLDAINCFVELYVNNRDDAFLKKQIIEVMLWCHDVSGNSGAKSEFYKTVFEKSYVVPQITIIVLSKIIFRIIKSIFK